MRPRIPTFQRALCQQVPPPLSHPFCFFLFFFESLQQVSCEALKTCSDVSELSFQQEDPTTAHSSGRTAPPSF